MGRGEDGGDNKEQHETRGVLVGGQVARAGRGAGDFNGLVYKEREDAGCGARRLANRCCLCGGGCSILVPARDYPHVFTKDT